MVESQCHSFEDASSAGSYNMPIISRAHSESSQDTGSIRRLQLTRIDFPFLKSPACSPESLPIPEARPIQATPGFQEILSTDAVSPERGRSRVRRPLNRDTARTAYPSPISPDRFIPKRDFGDSLSTPYRLNKHPQQLSPRERLLRRHLPGEDPFLPTPQTPRSPAQSPRPTWLRQRQLHRPWLINNLTSLGSNRPNDFLRQISSGGVWGMGGTSAMLGAPVTTTNGATSLLGRRTTAPNFVARFLPKSTKADEQKKHESRIALALDVDPTTRLVSTCGRHMERVPGPTSPDYERFAPFVWKDSAWTKGNRAHWPVARPQREAVPPKPFRILDAPYMRDDFYCSTLAYSFTSGVLAVGLAQAVYLWSEGYIVDRPPFGDFHPSNYVTSLSFSSENGGRSILAVGRQSGQLSLWSISEDKVRFEISHPKGISCVSFKPKTSRRPSEGLQNMEIDAEYLVVGDEIGNIWYYSVEWPEIHSQWSWTGCMTLLAKISAHGQQVCGLAWSPDGQFLASGGNDNVCMLFDLHEILPPSQVDLSAFSTANSGPSGNLSVHALPHLTPGTTLRHMPSRRQVVSRLLPSWGHSSLRSTTTAPLLCSLGCLISGGTKTVLVPPGHQKHCLVHGAAVKAIAFAPWQPSLLATGGGTNDRAIHFFHASTGVCLATINVFAQVTSLIWSQSRREIAATFGYASPEHPFRIAVFAWPSCAQVAVIPWGPHGASWDGEYQDVNYDCGRALYAVSYPGRPPRPLHAPLEDSDLLYATAPPPPLSHGLQPPGQANEAQHRRGPHAIRPKEKEGGMWCVRTMEEGCIIVASSDQTVKFHEVWTGRRKSTSSAYGILGGSDILEGMECIEKSGSEVIR
ncbi:uncharacterized protein N7484_009056 [Penicillium longicatenatum]|uniref:uncharacterized protein n=1 Tax=Penicillium longicatenatum TaxID=1561947 RepID=UPI00254880E1|nr:uncharacterized protein N7484_009056 [Penicillium longicatenatum]KAJ5635743.1 hypothetical protein N7484_009056 [Penicillium longicatenatum]